MTVVGLVKTHHRPLLPPADHARVSELECGERTPVFTLGSDRYSCYVRIAVPGPRSSPWFGIVRIEVPQSFGLKAACLTADEVTCVLPRYAGIPHRDPRAPQNLQPVGALREAPPSATRSRPSSRPRGPHGCRASPRPGRGVKADDWVRTREPLMGFAQGPSVEHGDGAPREIPAGAPCQVFSGRAHDRLGDVIHYDLDSGGSLDPYRVEAITEPEDVDRGHPTRAATDDSGRDTTAPMTDLQIGAIDGAAELTTRSFEVVLDDGATVQLDDLIVTRQTLPSGEDVAHYGSRGPEQTGRIEGAELPSDTRHIALAQTMPGQVSRSVQVSVLRTVPEKWVAPAPGGPVERAVSADRNPHCSSIRWRAVGSRSGLTRNSNRSTATSIS